MSNPNHPITNPSLLIVENNPDIAATLLNCLEYESYQIYVAKDETEALNLLDQKSIQVVVSDLALPNSDGIPFLNKVEQEFPNAVRLALDFQTDQSPTQEQVESVLNNHDDKEALRGTIQQAFNHYHTPDADPLLTKPFTALSPFRSTTSSKPSAPSTPPPYPIVMMI